MRIVFLAISEFMAGAKSVALQVHHKRITDALQRRREHYIIISIWMIIQDIVQNIDVEKSTK